MMFQLRGHLVYPSTAYQIAVAAGINQQSKSKSLSWSSIEHYVVRLCIRACGRWLVYILAVA
eukprot:5415864-Amphidinium_carterae.1